MKKTATSRALAAIETSRAAEPEKNRRRVIAIFDGIKKDGISTDPQEPPESPAPSLEDARSAIRIGELATEVEVALSQAQGIADVLSTHGDLEAAEQRAAWAISALIKAAMKSIEKAHREGYKYLPHPTMEQRQTIEEENHEAA